MKFAILIAGIAFFLMPSLNAKAGSGSILVADTQNGGILQYSQSGIQSTYVAVGGNFFGMTFDSTGNLFAASESGFVAKYTPNRTRTVFASGLGLALGLVFDANGNLFVAYNTSQTTGGIYKITPFGTRTTFDSGLITAVGLAYKSGILFVADAGAGIIYKYNAAGVRTVFATDLSPNSLAFDANGNLFVTDESGSILKFDSNGNRTTFASGLPASGVVGLAFDDQGNLYVAVTGNILKFRPDGSEFIFASGPQHPGGILFLPGPPVLNIGPLSSNSIQISWSSISPNYVLQTSSDLTTNNWNNAGLPITTAQGTNFSVVVPASAGNSFFRLEQ